MNAIRCPQCGMLNQSDDIGFPRCGQCHEDLVRCSSCRFWEATGCRHPQEHVRYTADDDVAKRCPGFRARTDERGPRLLSTIPAPFWVSTVLFLILLILIGSTWMLDPGSPLFSKNNPITLETMIPLHVRVGEPFLVRMQLTNREHADSSRIFIEVDRLFLGNVEPLMPVPAPRHMSIEHQTLLLEYDQLPPHGTMEIVLPFVAATPGNVPFAARVYSPLNYLRQETVSEPIIIQPASVAPAPTRAR